MKVVTIEQLKEKRGMKKLAQELDIDFKPSTPSKYNMMYEHLKTSDVGKSMKFKKYDDELEGLYVGKNTNGDDDHVC